VDRQAIRVTIYVALLRAVNVGGANRLAMSDLRACLSDAGAGATQTYLQSGNVVADLPASNAEIAGAFVRAAIARHFGIDVPTIALTVRDLAEIADQCPFSVDDPATLHAVVLPHPLGPEAGESVRALAEEERVSGGAGKVAIASRAAYLLTPEGIGRSRFAARLTRGPLADGTSRNWRTVMALLDMASA
jgi:uncharacterized protein (DUF1697 family)